MNGNSPNQWRLNGFIMVFLIVISIFLVVPHFIRNEDAYVVLQCSFFIGMLAVVYSLNHSRFWYFLELGCVIPFIIFDTLSLYYQSISYMLIAYAFSLIFLAVIMFHLIKKIVSTPLVSTNLIFGSLLAYFLAGILWAKLYFIENTLAPGSFHSGFTHLVNFNHIHFSESYNLQFNLIYYSFCTLTTLGLGDIIPLHNQAKALTLLEAMFGQLFVAIIIAKLVGVWRSPNSNPNS